MIVSKGLNFSISTILNFLHLSSASLVVSSAASSLAATSLAATLAFFLGVGVALGLAGLRFLGVATGDAVKDSSSSDLTLSDLTSSFLPLSSMAALVALMSLS